jgi:glycosidase
VNTTPLSQHPRFSGYRPERGRQDGAVRLFLPGHVPGTGEAPQAEIIPPGESKPRPLPLAWNAAGDVWESTKSVPPGTDYRFLVNGAPRPDLTEQHDTEHGLFNRVARNSAEAPERSTVIADIYLDSLVDAAQFEALKKQHGGRLPVRHQFNRFAPPDGNGKGLLELLPSLRKGGFSALLFKPFIGGDNLSSHRYWTVDPYRLNDSFRDKAEFREILKTLLKNGMKLYADGAFVNQGLNGVQMLANLAYGHRSPYWNWFRYSEPAALGLSEEGKKPVNPQQLRWEYPPNAEESRKQTFGILPTLPPDAHGHRALNLKRFDVRFVNEPDRDGYRPERPTFIELYDPERETADGRPRPGFNPGRERLLDGESSVYRYRFPVSADEVREKRKQTEGLDDGKRKVALTEWRRFRLNVAGGDDSGMKWDGHIPVALMNTRNPEVRHYLEGAVAYWSRVVMNTQVDAVSRALSQVLQTWKPSSVKASQDVFPHMGPPDTDDVINALKAITARPGVDADCHNPVKVLPPVTLPEIEHLSRTEIAAILDEVRQESVKNGLSSGKISTGNPDAGLPGHLVGKHDGKVLASSLLEEIPLSVLPLPDLFKATLSMPELPDLLRTGSHPRWRSLIRAIFTPLVGKTGFGGMMRALRDWLAPPPVLNRLGQRLQEAVDRLPPEARQKLAHPKIRSLAVDQLGESLLLNLVTGLEPGKLAKNQVNPKEIEEAFYQTVPPLLSNGDPFSGVRRLERFLGSRLTESSVLEPASLSALLADTLKPLDPLAVTVAEKVLQKREYGLNWRIDAAKDVADMDRVRNTEPGGRPAVFDEEMTQARDFWKHLGGAMRKPFPKASLIAELTDFDKLSDKPTAECWLNRLFSENIFSGAPNMSHLYSQLMQLVNYAQRPDEYGNSQMTPGNFVKEVLHPLSRSVPTTALNQFQNMVSSHDYNTASQALLVNPALFTMDLLRWWGLKDDFRVACGELSNKACFAENRAELARAIKQSGVSDPPDVAELLGGLEQIVSEPSFADRLPKAFRDFYDEAAKKPVREDPADESSPVRDASRYVPTPRELKVGFADAVFKALNAEERESLGLAADPAKASSGEHALETALRQVLKERMAEPGESKAMRGVIVNGMLALRSRQGAVNSAASNQGTSDFWADVRTRYGLDEKAVQRLRDIVEHDLWSAIDKAIGDWGRNFGYQPPDVALQQVFEHFVRSGREWKQAVPAFKNDPVQASAFADSLQSALYAEMLRPVLPRLLRLFAVQNALPGNPSVYLPDWFAQGGGEWTQNVFSQNRALIRTDKLKALDPNYRRFAERASAIFRTRSAGISSSASPDKGTLGPGALNEGVLLDVPADDEAGVLPIVRDNGREQVITLVYTGKPEPLDWLHKEGPDGAGYAAVRTQSEPLRDYRTQLKTPELVPGRTYRDATDGERFRLGEDGALVSLTHPGRGIDIADCRILVREPK